jgi:monoamine oxidase
VTDPDFAMAYSYLRADGHPADRDVLAEPYLGLQIAGEATWSPHPGTMHGAWFSGQRAAERVLTGSDGSTQTGDVLPVVVVGAGLAGLAAARTLRAVGRDVVLLEAGDTTLGRARGLSTPYGDVLPGAMWFHGTEGHPLLAYAQAAGIELRAGIWEVRDDDLANITSPIFTDDGLFDRSSHEEEIARFHAIESQLDAPHATDVVLGRLLDPLLEDLSPKSALVQETWFRTLYEGLVDGDIGDLSCRHRHEEFLLPGGDMMLTAPLSRAESLLLDGLDARLGHRVVSLSFTEGLWTITTERSGVFVASSVVLTASVDVVERLQIDPELPVRLRQSMARVGRGREGKFFAVFEEAFWSPLSSFFVAAPGSPLGRVFVDASEVLGRPTLLGFSTFHETERLETLDDATLRDELGALLEPVARWSDGCERPTSPSWRAHD